MATTTLPQPPEFVAAVQEYRAVYGTGVRDMDILGPLVQRAEQVFNWQPGPPVKPLTKRQIDRTVKKWMALPKETGDRLERLASALRDLPEDERSKILDMWFAIMDLMKQEPAA